MFVLWILSPFLSFDCECLSVREITFAAASEWVSNMINGVLITDRGQYFRQQGIDRQKNVVTYKTCTTVTTEALVWTYRTTNCDVTSIITTTVPFKDALMKDIQMETTEVKR